MVAISAERTSNSCNEIDWQTGLSASSKFKPLFATLANQLPALPANGAYRDQPLRFEWQAPHELIVALCMPSARNAAHAATRRMIVAEALLAAATNQGVSYSRRRSFYSGRRYRKIEYTCSTVLAAVDDLAREGWLFEQRAQPSSIGGWQSSFRATPSLALKAREIGGEPSFSLRETIILKDEDRNLVDYNRTRQTERLHRSLAPLNLYLKSLEIGLSGAVRQGHYLRVGDSLILPVPGNALRRVFNRSSFGCNGRAYAWWQNIPQVVRANLPDAAAATSAASTTTTSIPRRLRK